MYNHLKLSSDGSRRLPHADALFFFQATRTFVTRVLNYLTLLCCFSIIAFLYLFTKIGIWETGKIMFGCEMAEI